MKRDVESDGGPQKSGRYNTTISASDISHAYACPTRRRRAPGERKQKRIKAQYLAIARATAKFRLTSATKPHAVCGPRDDTTLVRELPLIPPLSVGAESFGGRAKEVPEERCAASEWHKPYSRRGEVGARWVPRGKLYCST